MQKKEKKTNLAKKLVLLDAHAIIHRAYHALPDFATSRGEPTGALYGISTMLIKIIEDLRPEYIVAAYDVKGPTYRHEAYKEYKQGRKKAEDDLVAQLQRSRDLFAAFNIPIYDKQGFEADDILGTIVTQLKDKKFTVDGEDIDVVIASGDMDTLQLVCGEHVKVFTLRKGITDTVIYDEDSVKERFGFGPELIPDYKGLRGDPSDNIPGVKGIGEKTAGILIQKFGTIEKMYAELEKGKEKDFSEAGITPRIIQVLRDNKEEAEFSKMLATIRRDVPISFVLPGKGIRDTINEKQVKAFWHELEFRTLGARLDKLLGNINGKPVLLPADVSAPASELKMQSEPSTEEFEKTALALWLVNSNVTNPEKQDILDFANIDDFDTAQKTIMDELDKRNVRRVYEEIELPLIPILHRMEKRGIKIDKTFLAKLSKEYHKELASLEKRIWEHAGVEFNIASPKQLGEILFDKLQIVVKNQKKTSGGARSTKESELEKMRDMHPIVPLIFEYRELAKLLGTYIDAIPPLLDENDRLHTHFIQTGSTTGRMATQNPGLQNIPIKTDLGRAIRKAFIHEEGYKLVSLDYSQAELRIAAFLSGDEKLIEIFRTGQDVHRSVASAVFNVRADEVTPEMRRQAKVINFGILYGMGVMALKQNLGTSRDEAQKFYNEYFQTFSTLATYLDRVKSETLLKGYTDTFFGRRRYFEGIKSKIPYIRAQAERMAINAPIQGTEADVVKLAMVRVDEYIKREKLEEVVYPLLQVHDELVYEIRDSEAQKISEDIKKIMETVLDPKDTRGVVLAAEAAIGDNWGELK
ncbi:MAG: DNA polymerase [Candidatus Paceibacterota bacterium]